MNIVLQAIEKSQESLASGSRDTKALPRLLTFGSPTNVEVNVTSLEASDPTKSTKQLSEASSHEEALKTIKRRNYPKVLPDIEKRRSLPPVPYYTGSLRHNQKRRLKPPSPPPRMLGVSRSLECVEDEEDAEGDEIDNGNSITTNLHVGPLKKRNSDSSKNQSDSTLSLPHSSDISSNPFCPIHGSKERITAAKSEPRIVISPILEIAQPLNNVLVS